MFGIERIFRTNVNHAEVAFTEHDKVLLSEIAAHTRRMVSLNENGDAPEIPITLPIPRGHPSLRPWPNVFDMACALGWDYSTDGLSLHFKKCSSTDDEDIAFVSIRKKFDDRSEELTFSVDESNVRLILDVIILPGDTFRGKLDKLRNKKLRSLAKFIEAELPDNPIYYGNKRVMAETLYGLVLSSRQLSLV